MVLRHCRLDWEGKTSAGNQFHNVDVFVKVDWTIWLVVGFPMRTAKGSQWVVLLVRPAEIDRGETLKAILPNKDGEKSTATPKSPTVYLCARVVMFSERTVLSMSQLPFSECNREISGLYL